MSFIPDIEKQSVENIKTFQEEKLNELLHYVALHSPFYKKLFKEHAIEVDSIQSLENLSQIPVTTKEDIQQFNWDFLCVPRERIIEYTSTSGTLGMPVTIALTEADMKRLSYNEYISFSCAEVTDKDLFQLMLTMDRQFMAGLAYYEGLRKLGAGIIRLGPGSPAMHWESIIQYRPTGLIAVPSVLVGLINYAKNVNLDISKSSVQKAICIGESIRNTDLSLNELGKRIQDNWEIELYSTYASTEMQTAFTECSQGMGGHHHPELLIVELLDENLNAVADGEAGEVVITTLGIEGMPLLRYQTGDVAIRYTEPCACGRNTMRLSPLLGRKKQMIKLKGTTLYPQGIIDVLHKFDAVRDFVIEISREEFGLDQIKIHLEVVTTDDVLENLLMQIKEAFKIRLRVIPQVVLSTSEKLNKLQEKGISRKLKRIVDNRA